MNDTPTNTKEIEMKPVIKVTQSDVKNILDSQKGKFFTAIFIGKKDKKEHTINGRRGVKKYLRGGVSKIARHPELMGAFNVKKGAYRTINLEGVTEIRANGVIYQVG